MSPVEAVSQWLEQLVVGQNFCPFAGKPLAEGRVLVTEIRSSSSEDILLACHATLKLFLEEEKHETILFVLPKGFEDFMEYLDLADTFELMLEESFGDELGLATFHPNYQFAEFKERDVVHHIHRSPYPVLHVLREDSLDVVRDNMEDTAEITKRNHSHAKMLGVEFFDQFKVR